MLYGKKVVALCTARLNDSIMNNFISSFNNILKDNNCALLVYSLNSELYWNEEAISTEVSVFELIDYDITDVIVMMDERIKSRTVAKNIISEAKAHSVPVLTVDGKYEGIPYVGFDHEKGFEKVVRHVIEDHEVRRPHFLAGIRGNAFSDRRIEIFKKVIAENNIPFDESMLSYGDFWAKPAAEAAQRIVDSGNIPEAVICANDIMAINVCNVFKENNIKVPQQVIVTGFDGLDEIYFTAPKISSACCDSHVLAKEVYRALAEILKGNSCPDDIFVVPSLLPNSSCGCEEYIDNKIQINMINNSFYHYQDDLRILFDISGRMQTCDTPEQMAAHLHNHLMKDMCCIINKSCLRRDIDYFSEDIGQSFDSEMYMIYDSFADNYDLIPVKHTLSHGSSALEKLFSIGSPIIYNAVVFTGKTLGFVCFYSDSKDIIDFFRMFQISMTLGVGLGGYITRQRQKYLSDKVEEMYKSDALTGLFNRNGFNAAFSKITSQNLMCGQTVTVVVADLDGLKYINDTFGHNAGDHALKTVANILKDSCPKDAICVRHGGDEMLAMIFGEDTADEILDEMNSMFSELDRTSELEYKISASYGYYRTELTPDFDLEFAMKQADIQMYTNKKSKQEV